MKYPAWADEFAGAVTVCDARGIILYMNAKSAKVFGRDGGLALIGKNILDCHPEPARAKLAELMAKRASNAYTIEKNLPELAAGQAGGIKKLIYQSPWYEKGEYKGFVELSLEIPFDMPHFKRGNQSSSHRDTERTEQA
ncbi:MAG: PAS domain-containing protein [Candidatus Brocadiia bacterium]